MHSMAVFAAVSKPMADFSINEIQEMQKALQDKYKHKWEPICAEIGQNKLLWMIGEIGEVIELVNSNMSNRYNGAGVMGLLRQFLNLCQ